jgi:hypothetical protein
MFDLIIGIDPRAERLALEGIVKEFAAFVSSIHNSEAVADHFCAVALEGCCVLTKFAALGAFVLVRAVVRDSVDTVASFGGFGKSCAAFALKLFLHYLLAALLRNE